MKHCNIHEATKHLYMCAFTYIRRLLFVLDRLNREKDVRTDPRLAAATVSFLGLNDPLFSRLKVLHIA